MALPMQGSWTVAFKGKNAAFAQRFVIGGATAGRSHRLIMVHQLFSNTPAVPALPRKGR